MTLRTCWYNTLNMQWYVILEKVMMYLEDYSVISLAIVFGYMFCYCNNGSRGWT